MKIGFTFDENACKNNSETDMIEELYLNGIKSLEIVPDDRIMTKDMFKSIINVCDKLNLDASFHSPTFVHEAYDLLYFRKDRDEFKKQNKLFFEKIKSWQQKCSKEVVFVVHGAKIEENNFESAFDSTLYSIDWMMNYFIKNDMKVTTCIETLRENSSTIGKSREELLKVINKFKDERLGICLDTSHDYFNNHILKFEDYDFFKEVKHVHIHGNKKVHGGIDGEELKIEPYIKSLKEVSYKQNLNLEILERFSEKGYIEEIKTSIEILEKIINKQSKQDQYI